MSGEEGVQEFRGFHGTPEDLFDQRLWPEKMALATSVRPCEGTRVSAEQPRTGSGGPPTWQSHPTQPQTPCTRPTPGTMPGSVQLKLSTS